VTRISIVALSLGLVCAVGCAPATGTHLAALAGDAVNVRDFGAVGDGVTDDQAAINAALHSGATRIYLPAGTYLAVQVGPFPDGSELYGDGDTTAVLQSPGAGPSVRLLQIGPVMSNPPATPGVWIHDLVLDGNRAAQTPDEHRSGVFASNAPGIRVERVTARNFTGDGLYFYNGTTPTVATVTCTGNGRNGLTVGGGVPTGSFTGSTFVSNAVQQFDSEGGPDQALTITGNTFDGGGVSSDYALTITGGGATAHSSGWTIAGNTIHGSVAFRWADSMLFTSNTITQSGTKPPIDIERGNRDLTIRGNTITGTRAAAPSGVNLPLIYVSGAGPGDVPSGVVIEDNTLLETGPQPRAVGVWAQGADSIAVRRNIIAGPGVAGGFPGVYLRATLATPDFVAATIIDNTIRNWGLGVSVDGNAAAIARLDVLTVENNTCDDTTGAMVACLALDHDRSHAARDIREVGDAVTGRCSTLSTGTMTGTWTALGNHWTLP
jgi:pectate lyase-like protein